MIDFVPFPKLSRLSRDVIISEKIDGTNAQICITEDMQMLVGSRNRWITTDDDNYGFARWCHDNRGQLITLGPGHHYGEWWGSGIQRGYGLVKGEKRFSLFNVERWCLHNETPRIISTHFSGTVKMQEPLPPCCGLVPVLYRGPFVQKAWEDAITTLASDGSKAAPGFKDPEGIVIFHTASQIAFKKTINNDDKPKSNGEK